MNIVMKGQLFHLKLFLNYVAICVMQFMNVLIIILFDIFDN